MRWREVSIGELGRIITGKTPPTGNREFYDGEYPFVTPTDLDWQSYIVRSTHSSVTELARNRNKNQFIPANSTVFTCIGNTIGKCGLSAVDCLTNQQINSVVPADEHDPKFVYYLLNYYRPQIRSLGLGNGAAQPIINKTTFSAVKVSVPATRDDEQRIAAILSAYDDLIENNRRRIALLEEAARQLYREWFVRFRFPGHEHVKIIDGVPEGWEMRSFDTLADFLNGFAFKPHHLGDAGLPIVKIPELKGGVLVKTPRYDGEGVPEKYLLNTGDLIFSWSGTLAIDFWCDGPAYLNQHLFKVMPYDDVSAAHLLVAIREAMVMFENQTVGATMKHIRRSALSDVKVPVPPVSLYSSFRDAVDSLYSQVVNLRNLSRNAAKARDLLLPKLMSGAIAV